MSTGTTRFEGSPKIGRQSIGETYNFPGSKMGYDKARRDKKLLKCFKAAPSENDGFQVDECKDSKEQCLLQFLIPIFSLDKPTTCTSKLLRSIFGAYIGSRECSWGLILEDVFYWKWQKIGSKKRCPLAPFLYHLYSTYGVFTNWERYEWEQNQVLVHRKLHHTRWKSKLEMHRMWRLQWRRYHWSPQHRGKELDRST